MSNKHKQLSKERKQLQKENRVPLWYSTQSWQLFKSKYMVDTEGDVKSRFQVISRTLVKHLPVQYRDEYETKFFDLMWKGILSPASPVLANTGTNRGTSVSCSGQYIPDSIEGFYSALKESALLSKNGFGTSGYFGDIRPRGSKITGGGIANGAKPVIEDFFQCAANVSHGGMRVGSFAAYIDMDSSVYDECVASLHLDHKGKNYGWNITDTFTQKLVNQEPEALAKWQECLNTKLLTGKGYLNFPDKANRHRPQMYKDLGLDIKASNLCTEIQLHSSEKYTFSCILSSMNLFHWDTIKTSDAVFTATVFLDCLCSEFLEQAEHRVGLEKVRDFTIKGRAIGLGVMGLSTYLQDKRIPFESLEAMFINNEMFKHIHDESLRASQWLASILGEPEWCKGYGVRNTHRTAVAPTKSTAGLLGGMSESVFVDPAMAFTAGSVVGELARIPPVFLGLMKERGTYNQDTITDIINHIGSVQHVDWLDEHEKQVFKNAFECDPFVNFRYAKQRQKYLCQGQSLNFFLPNNENTEQVLSDLMTACVLDDDILSQYYVYTRSGVVIKDECIGCHG